MSGLTCQRYGVVLLVAAIVGLALTSQAHASRFVRYGVQDDAWLRYGPGTLDQRVATLQHLGVGLVRYTLNWRELEPAPGNYDWSSSDPILHELHRARIGVVATLWGTPRWANGGRGPNWAPRNGRDFADFARQAARRYRFIQRWLIWNEPNKGIFLRPTSARVYALWLLNPAYVALHRIRADVQVGAGVTAPSAGIGGLSPVRFIQQLGRDGARLDAYAHNPYPRHPTTESPTSGACGHCLTITMASLDRLLYWVRREFGRKRIWLTEYGYQTDPPDRYLGISLRRQAAHVAEAALRAYEAPRVDMLIHYMVRDDRALGGWQSGLFAADGGPKPAYRSFMLPLAEVARRGRTTIVWGQVRPRRGRQPYRLEQLRGGRWYSVGGVRWTDVRGSFQRIVRAPARSTMRVWSPRDRCFSLPLTVA